MATETTTLPQIPHWVAPPATKEDLPYADLPVIDLSKFATEEGRAELTKEVCDAMREHGFLIIVNHGYTQEQTDRVFDITDVPFSQVSMEEKKKYEGTMLQTGSYQGYKLRNYWHIVNGIQDQIEHYNFNHDVTIREHPEALRPLLPEVSAFAKHNHFNIVFPILRLMARGLELPEDTFTKMHSFESHNESYVRYMKYYPRSEEEENGTKQVWLKGHVDFSTITVLWSQPIGGLQVQTRSGEWRWVKYIPNSLVINTGDALEFLSGGYYRATIHRVIQPPADQRGLERIGAFYFTMADDETRLSPVKDSPVLQRVGITKRVGLDDEHPPTMREWRKARTSAYGKTKLVQGEDGVDHEVINGVVVRHYN